MYAAAYAQTLLALGAETWLLAPEALVAAMPESSAAKPTFVVWDVGSILRDPESRPEGKAVRLWQSLGSTLAAAANERDRYPDCLVLLYMDSFAPELLPRSAIEKNIRCPFAGLWFKPPRPLGWSFRDVAKRLVRWGRRYQILRSPLCATVLLLDKTETEHLTRRRLPSLVEVPEFSDNRLPDHEPPLVQEIRRRADGRHIYALVGSLEARKGIRAFLKAASSAPGDEWYFVMAGKVAWSTFDAETRSALAEANDATKNSLFFIDRWLDDDTLNAIVATSRLLHACYEAWPYSSNMLCKASAFGVPVIAVDYGYLGRKVRNYGLGMTVVDTNQLPSLFVPGFACSMQAFARQPAFVAGCKSYLADNGPAALADALRAALPQTFKAAAAAGDLPASR
jgi:glycosyltransferase involved in cell wall biosynthesis